MARERLDGGRWSTVPLPLVQLVQASQCSKTAAERFFFAHQLWDTTIQFLSSVCLASWASGQPDAVALPNAFPSLWRVDPEDPASASAQTPLAHWWRWVRLLLPGLCNGNNLLAVRLRDWLYTDCPLQEQPWLGELKQLLGLTSSLTWPRSPSAWFEHYILGSAALGAFESASHTVQEWDAKSQTLVQTLEELLAPGNFLGQTRLVYLSGVEQQPDGTYRLERLELSGKVPRVLPPLFISPAETSPPPTPGRLYLEAIPNLANPGRLLPRCALRREQLVQWSALCLYPFVVYHADTEETFFLQGVHAEKEAVFVAPMTGRVYHDPTTSESLRQVIERLVQHSATAELARKWLTALNSTPTDGATGSWLSSHHAAGYELLSEVPCGPNAVQYRAWQVSLRRPVRLQCLLHSERHPVLPEEELSLLYGLLRLHHQHLIKVYEHGVKQGIAYAATEFVPGVTLSGVFEKLHLRQRQALPSISEWYQAIHRAWQEESGLERPLCDLHTYERRLARYLLAPHWPEPKSPSTNSQVEQRDYVHTVLLLVSRLADAVHVLHEMGLTHGGIVPGRILLTNEDGRPVLLEPSFSFDISANDELAHSLRFLSPERRASSARVSPSADIYSLAAITLELLTLPVENVSSQDAVTQARLAHQLGLPAGLVTLLCQCVSKNPEERPNSARELAHQLREFARQVLAITATNTTQSPDTQPARKSDASLTKETGSPPELTPSKNALQQPSRLHRLAAAGSLLAGGLVLTVATFWALSWWVGLKPLDLLHLVAHRTFERRSPQNQLDAVFPTASTPSSATLSSPPLDGTSGIHPSATTTSNVTGAVDRLEKQLQLEQQRAEELVAQLQRQRELLAQEKARAEQLEKALAANHQQEELINRLRQEIKQHQAYNELAQQRYMSLQKELDSLKLQCEALAAEKQSLRQEQFYFCDISPEAIQQWLHATGQSGTRPFLPEQVRRSLVPLWRDALVARLKTPQAKDVSPLTLANRYLILGLLEFELGSYEDAQTAFKEAWNQLNRVPAETRQRPEYKFLNYSIHYATARLHLERKQYPEAEAAWLQAFNSAETACKESKYAERWSEAVAHCHQSLANLYRLSRQLDKAESAYHNAIRSWEKLHNQRGGELTAGLNLARCYQGLAYLAELRDLVEVAEQNYKEAVTILENLRTRQPPQREVILMLAQVLAERASLYRDSGQAQESLAEFQRAMDLVRPLAVTKPVSPDVLLALRDIYAGRAHAYALLRRHADALRDWDEAIACDWEYLPTLRAYRAISLARLGHIEHAASEADRLSQEQPKTGSLLYNLACVHAVLAEVSTQDSTTILPEQKKRQEIHAAQAVELLRQAAHLGYFRNSNRLDYLKRDPDLDALRQREDFRRLLDMLTQSNN